MTTNQDALLKIRHQIQIAESYHKNNPDFETSSIILSELRERERILANKVQVEILKSGIEQTDALFENMKYGE
jgi:hypothetical protein